MATDRQKEAARQRLDEQTFEPFPGLAPGE